MAYPPTIPPNTRTNDTAQVNNHPGDHNALADALTDVVNELGADPSGASATVQARLAAIDSTITGLPGGVRIFPSNAVRDAFVWPPGELVNGRLCITTDSYQEWVRKDGTWIPVGVVGMVVRRFLGVAEDISPTLGAPGRSGTGFGPLTGPGQVLMNRTYMVNVKARFQLKDAVTDVTLAAHFNIAGSGYDPDSDWHGGAPEFAVHQRVWDVAFPLLAQNAIQQGNWQGTIITQGTPGAPALLRCQLVLNNTTALINVGELSVTLVDAGPA